MLVSSASTTNTREIKNRFRLERLTVPCAIVLRKKPRGTAPHSTKIVKTKSKNIFLWIFFYVYMIFCLCFFFTIICLLHSFCFDNFTKNYLYIHTVFLRFLCFFFVLQYFVLYFNVYIYIFICIFMYRLKYNIHIFATRVQSTPAAALQILRYGFCFRFLLSSLD